MLSIWMFYSAFLSLFVISQTSINNTYMKKSLCWMYFLFLFGKIKEKKKREKYFKGKKNGSSKISQTCFNPIMHRIFWVLSVKTPTWKTPRHGMSYQCQNTRSFLVCFILCRTSQEISLYPSKYQENSLQQWNKIQMPCDLDQKNLKKKKNF